MWPGSRYLGWQVAAGDEVAAAGATTCDADPISVTVAPLLEDLMQEAADHLATKANCINLEVTDATVDEVQDGLDELDEADRADALPDLWVPNSPVWRTVLQRVGYTGRVEAPALATSPVGLASGRDGAPGQLAADAASDRLRDERPGDRRRLGLRADRLALGGHAPSARCRARSVPMAQTFGETVTSGIEVATNADVLKAGES